MEINFLFLGAGFIFTFFIPGFLIMNTFFPELPLIHKLPFYSVLSILVSTYVVYLISLGIGFSRISILVSFCIFGVWFVIFLINNKLQFKNLGILLREHSKSLLVSLIVFSLFLIALYPAIFSRYQNYFVMSAVNWQDTAMHQSIIESISQGNFPPQAPYFSGKPLNYYYFIDLHTAILQTLYGDFFPQILIYDNPFFVLTFFLSVYSLGVIIFKDKLTSILAAFIVIFSSNFLYVNFFGDIFQKINSPVTIFLVVVKDIIANHGYTLDYGKLIQMAPMTDYFLQNRPMMIGLPAVVLVLTLLIRGYKRNENKYIVLIGILTGMLYKFQLFAFGICILIYLLSIFSFEGKVFKKRMIELGCFFIPLVLILTTMGQISRESNSYALRAFLENFRLGVWDQTKDFFWYLKFPFVNLGIPFFLFFVSIILVIFKKLCLTSEITFLFTMSITLYLIPHIVFFTIYSVDMLKFFHFLLIFLSLISAWVLQKIWHIRKVGSKIVIFLILISSFNGFLTLGWSFLNKRQAYSLADYQAGIWVRNNTLPNSVFMTLPTVHSAPSDIGGRVRVLSYIVWPYSHGFNEGSDSVFTRQADIQSVYKDPSDIENAKKILTNYNVKYIYLGSEEESTYPLAKKLFDLQGYIKLVYNNSGTGIYKVL